MITVIITELGAIELQRTLLKMRRLYGLLGVQCIFEGGLFRLYSMFDDVSQPFSLN